jgi:hypothetical protein
MRIEATIRRFTILVIPEEWCWAEYANGQYGLAITYWRRAKWQYGVRCSLLWGRNRPFVRVTTYSCPTAGTAGTVSPLKCVLPHTNAHLYRWRRD